MWWEYVSGTVTAFLASCGVYIAWKGLQTWREQLHGTSSYTVAREAIKALCRIRAEFIRARCPFIYLFEYPEDAKAPDGELKQNFDRAKAYDHIFRNRLKPLNEAFITLEDKILDTQVEFGIEFPCDTNPLRKLRADLVVAMGDFCRMHNPALENLVTTLRREEVRQIVEGNLRDQSPDDFSQRVDSAILGLEAPLRKVSGMKNRS
jgi:hypothetical protein